MAYVPGFHSDIFVSYASEDHDEHMVKFIDDLRLYLKRELGKLFPEESIFFDRRALNERPVNWRDELEEGARSSAILLPLLSPCYATSDWCAQELAWFQSSEQALTWKAKDERSVYRFLPVRWRSIDQDTFEDLAIDIQNAQHQLTASCEQVGAKLVEGLKLMRRSCKTVYLGETKADVRVRVRDELSRSGYRVVPEGEQAFDGEARVRTHLSSAILAVHFVGGQTLQRALDAIDWSLKSCSGATVVYQPPELDLNEVERQHLVWIADDVQAFDIAEKYDHVERKNLDHLLQTLRDRLSGAGVRAATKLGMAFEEADRPAVEWAATEIEAATGFVIHRHGLGLADIKKSRSVLFYWGAAEGRRLRKAVAFSVGHKAFLLAPPPKLPEHASELTGGRILRQQGDQFRVDDVGPFLKELGWPG